MCVDHIPRLIFSVVEDELFVAIDIFNAAEQSLVVVGVGAPAVGVNGDRQLAEAVEEVRDRAVGQIGEGAVPLVVAGWISAVRLGLVQLPIRIPNAEALGLLS